MNPATTTDLLITEMAAAAGITQAEAVIYLSSLTPEQVGQMADMTARLTVANIKAEVTDPVGAAHRRVGHETGLALAKALAAKNN